METTPPPPPAPAGGEGKKAKEVKRARKRSRYLSPPYYTTDQEDASLLHEANVATADLLSALLQSASASASASPNGVLLRFFSLYRISSSLAHQDAADADADTCHVTSKKQDEEDHINGRPAVKAALVQAEAGHKKDASKTSTNSIKMNKTRKKRYLGNPAALVLDFTKQDAAVGLPSKEQLLSSFRRFGFLIESETNITKDPPRARVVFGSSTEAEAVYSCACAHTLGRFGPPFTLPRLEYLPPISIRLNLNAPASPAPKLPLSVIRKNLEKMIWSLTRPSNDTAHSLVGEMQVLMAKVDKVLSAGSSGTTGHHH